ncbi:MAG: hypothetical protein JSU87_12690 [Gemmatimonadota bacterium]|nr:MAG: hypothetical protein JSU87_12690 [Gemmatimonadota bacterium]
MLLRTQRLVLPAVRYVGEDVVRGRRVYLVLVLTALATIQSVIALRGDDATSNGSGAAFLVGLLLLSAPLCRSWLEEDVELGLAAWWFQKPIRPFDLYVTRLCALLIWSLLLALAVTLASTPGALISGRPLAGAIRHLLGLGWIPPLLVVLSFLGSGLGARNSALFAYGLLLAGFAVPGFADAVWLGQGYEVVKLLCPPAWAALAASEALAAGDLRLALASLRPVACYTLVGVLLGVGLASRVTSQLGRQD